MGLFSGLQLSMCFSAFLDQGLNLFYQFLLVSMDGTVVNQEKSIAFKMYKEFQYPYCRKVSLFLPKFTKVLRSQIDSLNIFYHANMLQKEVGDVN